MTEPKLEKQRKPPKPWTESKGLIAANAVVLQRAHAINELLVAPIALLPAAEGDGLLPFKIGIWAELRALLKPDTPVVQLRKAISAYTHSKRYIFATAQPDAMRHAIDGTPVEPVSAENRYAAQLVFVEIARKWREADAAAAKTEAGASDSS